MAGQEPKKQVDDDILQCKADIFQSEIVPENLLQKDKYEQEVSLASKESETIPIEAVEFADIANDTEDAGKIPAFDLAEEIMAKQRQRVATKRKSPGAKKAADIVPLRSAKKQQRKSSPKDKIIADIVAKDIKKLCKS